MTKIKKLQLISLSTYCHRAKTWTKDDIFLQEIQKEDLINHPYQRIKIPKLKYPKSSVRVSTGLLNFFKSEVNQILP